jgi:hypothetical protein
MSRYYKPNVSRWKNKSSKLSNKVISNGEKNKTIRRSFGFFDWTVTFTKKCVQISFGIFVLANIFITAMITVNFIKSGELGPLETYMNEVYNMFITVIGGYIIKSATENTMKIGFSVISDYLQMKYGSKLEEDSDTSDITEESDEEESGEEDIDAEEDE